MALSLRFKRRTEPGWLAIHLHADRIDIAHVLREAGKPPRLKSLESVPKEGTDSEALGKLRRSMHLQNYRCTTMVEPDAYQVVQVDAPNVGADELKAALKWRIKDLLEFPADQAIVEALDVPVEGAPAGRPHLMFAVAARRDAVAARVQAFQQAGVPLAVIDVPEMGQRNIASLFEEGQRGIAMLAFYERGGLLTFTRGGELFAVRRIEVTASALAEADAERRVQLFERVGLELQRSLDNFDRQFSHVPVQRLLVCPFGGAASLVDYLKQNLFVPVEVADIASALQTGGAPLGAAEQERYLAALGLALRDEA
jgi:MSHA biogenesis protein MshI